MNNYWIDIHEPGQDAVRSVRISGVARVGRGAICEIQLRAPRIGMIECVLRHQAGRWQLCPLPGSTQARVGSADVTATTTIERDVPFQIGAFQLCLREAANGQVAQPGSRSSPLEARWSARKADRPPTPTTASSNRVEAPKPGLPQRPYTAPTRRSEQVQPALNPSLARLGAVRHDLLAPRNATTSHLANDRPSVPAESGYTGPSHSHIDSRAALHGAETSQQPDAAPLTPPSPPSAVFEEDERVASSAVVVAEAAIGCQAEAPEFLDQDDLEARSAWDASDAPAPEKPALLVSHDFALHEDEFHSVHPQSRVVEADAEPFAARHSTIEPRPTSREPVLLSDAGPSWPSTSAILSANRSGQPGALAAPASQRRSRPEPTECRMPAFFALRSRAAIAAALVVAAFGGGASLFVAGLISLDNQAAGKAAALLDGGEAPLSPKMLTDLTRQGPWWATTAEHLRIKAALLGAVPDDAAATAETRALLERAAALNPADPAISAAISSERFATPDSAFDRYQPSRDIWPLVASARARFARGQADRAAENLRDAGTLAMQAEVDLAEPVTAAQDPPTDRLPLPNVPLFGPIAVALLDQKLSGVEGLRPLLPEYGPAWLAVYLEQQRRGQPQAELLGHLCELPDDAPDGASTALHLAARAEGLALRGELDRSIELYEAAIGHAQGRDWAAVLWINLSRLLTKNHQDERALAARQAAQRFTRNDSPAARRLKRWLDDAAHSRRDR